MSFISKIAAGVLGAAILLAASGVSAATYIVSFSGTVASGKDSGVFGPPGDLTGRSFVATYTYSSDNLWDYQPGVSQSAYISKAALTIGGATYVFPTYDLLANYATAGVGSLNFVYWMSTDADPVDLESLSNTATSAWFQPNIAFDVSAVISAPGDGYFSIHKCCCPHCGPNYPDVLSQGTFTSDKVTISVPEPASWALMIGGFGLTGAALRRRRRAIAA